MKEPPLQAHISRRKLLINGTLGLAAMLSAPLLYACGDTSNSANNCIDASPVSDASKNTITVNFLYSTEKNDWLTSAIDAFHSIQQQCNGKRIHIKATDSGSVDFADQILNNKLQPRPDAWSPASDLALNRLDHLWQLQNGGQLIINRSSADLSPKPLLQAPFVFAIWKDRAKVLEKAYGSIDWDTLHAALSLPDGWQSRVLENPKHGDWGTQIHLGQTQADLSNSGLLSIILMACAPIGKSNQNLSLAQASDAAVWWYIYRFERAVNQFGQSSGTYFLNTVIPEDSGAHAIVLTYENLVLTQPNPKGSNPLQMFYPKENFINTHPFAILNNSSKTPEELQETQQAAKIFRDFLREDEQQKKAIRSGFRPWDWENKQQSLTDQKDSPFNNYAKLSPAHPLDQRFDLQITTPLGEVVNTMICQWHSRYNPGIPESGC